MSKGIDDDLSQTQSERHTPIESSTVSTTEPEKKSKLLSSIKRHSSVITIIVSVIALFSSFHANVISQQANAISQQANEISHQANEISQATQQENHEFAVRQSEYNARSRHLEQLEGYVSQVSSIYNRHTNIDQGITDEDRNLLIEMYESLEQLLNHNNPYYDELKSEFESSINQIDNSITGSDKKLPNAGSLPNLEDAFADYQTEEYRLIWADFGAAPE